MDFAVFCLGEIEEYDMRVQLRCGITPYWSGAVVFEFRCYPLASCFCRKIPADAGLNIPLQFVECDADAFSMRFPHPVISAHKGGQRYAFRGRERCIPSRS